MSIHDGVSPLPTLNWLEPMTCSTQPSSPLCEQTQSYDSRRLQAAVPFSPGVHEELARYQYVLVPCARPVTEFRPWFTLSALDASGQRQHIDPYTWLRPFLPQTVAEHPGLQAFLLRGAPNAKSLPVALRSLIREKRKAKEPHRDLLQALYGACVLVDFVESLKVEFQVFFHDVAHLVDFDDLLTMRCDFIRMGYRRVQALKPADVKWLVSEFGEPALHLSYVPLWDSLRRDAVRRYSRAEIARNDSRIRSEQDVEEALPEWLRGRIEFSIRLHAENRARAEATLARNRQWDAAIEGLEDVWKSTDQNFIVADLETTGLDPKSCEILGLAAVLSNSAGKTVAEFSALVRVKESVPTFITELTGISQLEVDQEGRPLGDVLQAFLRFAGSRPVFFHNAPFDISFLQEATRKFGLPFSNVVHDTLPLARAVWPEMRSHKLETLAKIIDAAPPPTHRALADARTTLAVLLAAREAVGREVPEE